MNHERLRIGANEDSGGRGGSFAERYCRFHGIAREGFMLAILRRTLHSHVRPFFSVITEVRPDFFTADLDFIVAMARVRRASDYELAVMEFAAHPANRRFGRRWLRLRVSAQRMRRLLREIYVRKFIVLCDEDDSGSIAPFEVGCRLPEPARREVNGALLPFQ